MAGVHTSVMTTLWATTALVILDTSLRQIIKAVQVSGVQFLMHIIVLYYTG